MRRVLPGLLGAVLLVGGVVTYLLGGRLPSRLHLATGTVWQVDWTAGQLAGGGLAVLGLLLLAGWAGRRLGRGTRRPAWPAGALGVAAVAAGVTVFRRADAAGPAGWYAHAPLSSSPAYTSTLTLRFDGTGEVVQWGGEHALGAGLVVLGAVLLAAAAGRLSARGGAHAA